MATAGSLIRQKMLERQLSQREICHAQEHAPKKTNLCQPDRHGTNYMERRFAGIMRADSQKILGIAFRISSEARREANTLQRRGFWVVSIFTLFAFFTIGVFAFLIARSITKPIGTFVKGVQTIGGGDLGHRIDIKSRDEIGQLSQAFDEMVHKRESAEKNLREERDRAQKYLDIAEVVFVVINVDQEVVQINKKGCEILGYGEGEIIGRNWFDTFLPERIQAKTKEVFNKLMAGEGKFADYYESTVVTRGGKERLIGWHNKVLTDDTGRTMGTLSSGEDITERKRMEHELKEHHDHLEELVRDRTKEVENAQTALVNLLENVNLSNQALESANERLLELDRLKSMFIASMSHELRTPLNSIIGFTGIILQGMAGEINPEQRDQLQRVYGSAKHLLALINDVIDISKVEAGKFEVHVEKFQLNDVIREAVSNLTPEIAKKGLDIEISLAQDNKMASDRKRLLQCILNFLSNAVKFTEKGGIGISAHEVDGMVEISVKDTGIGIKEADVPRLFGSFVRIDSPIRNTVLGTGLGLYLTRKIVTEMLKGEVYVESTYGEGSRFGLRIPVEVPKVTEKKEAPS